MARWEPDAKGRLQRAAMTLFIERGYADVTVADITESAGLTKRTFFNHFSDKREVLFADAGTFEATLASDLAAANPATEPLQVATVALTKAGLSLAEYGAFAGTRRDLIASSTELQERNLVKNASMRQTIQDALIGRGVAHRTARFTADMAITAFNAGYDDWIDDPKADFAALMNQALNDLRSVLASHTPVGRA